MSKIEGDTCLSMTRNTKGEQGIMYMYACWKET